MLLVVFLAGVVAGLLAAWLIDALRPEPRAIDDYEAALRREVALIRRARAYPTAGEGR